jgi:AcrR family transcriptional regulator
MENAFYTPEDYPAKDEKKAIWSGIKQELPVSNAPPTTIFFHFKSFAAGMAAAILLILAGFGARSLLRDAGLFPEKHSLDAAYTEAMERLLQAAPQHAQTVSHEGRMKLELRLKGIEDVDAMIEEIRNDMLLYGNSDFKQKQLRNLYAIKMDMVKELLLDGEFSL